MGNLCGKQESESFSSPGRTLGSAPPQPKTAAVPASATASKPPRVGGPPRTLGGGGGPSSESDQDARRRAAEAAETRAKGKPTGKLGEQLAAQKKQTRNDTLKEASANEARYREIDANNDALSHR